MKIRQITCLSIALFLPQLSPAKVAMPAQSLGQIESILDFCAKVNPELAPKLPDAKKVLAGDATDKEVAEVRAKQEYKDSYQASSDQLAKVPRENAVKSCSAFIEPKR